MLLETNCSNCVDITGRNLPQSVKPRQCGDLSWRRVLYFRSDCMLYL